MSNIPDIDKYNELNIYYESDYLDNTNYAGFEDDNLRKPDAYIGFHNNIFSYSQTFFNGPDKIMDTEWYY